MSSACIRAFTRGGAGGRLLRPLLSKPKAAATPPTSAGIPSRASRRSFTSSSRLPAELGCCAGLSMYPLHSAVAVARMTSRLSAESRSCTALSQGILCRTYPGL